MHINKGRKKNESRNNTIEKNVSVDCCDFRDIPNHDLRSFDAVEGFFCILDLKCHAFWSDSHWFSYCTWEQSMIRSNGFSFWWWTQFEIRMITNQLMSIHSKTIFIGSLASSNWTIIDPIFKILEFGYGEYKIGSKVLMS